MGLDIALVPFICNNKPPKGAICPRGIQAQLGPPWVFDHNKSHVFFIKFIFYNFTFYFRILCGFPAKKILLLFMVINIAKITLYIAYNSYTSLKMNSKTNSL
jgi:hypothetical protein